MVNSKARWWIGTIFPTEENPWTPPETCAESLACLKGQLESCPESGREHYQILAVFKRQVRLAHVKSVVGPGHWEPTRSQAAREYVWKERTRVPGTQFEIGAEPIRRNNATDWDAVRRNAQEGNLELVPADIYVRYIFLTLAIISPSLQSLLTIKALLQLNESVSFFGAGLVLAKVSERGKRQVFRLTLRIPDQNGGADTRIRHLLSSMSFVVESIFPTYYDGWTDILYLLRPKDHPGPSWLPKSGLPAIWILDPGTPI